MGHGVCSGWTFFYPGGTFLFFEIRFLLTKLKLARTFVRKVSALNRSCKISNALLACAGTQALPSK